MQPTKKSTLVLVAERAGVSIASVSRVMNGLPASDQLIAKVRQAADELGYVPDATARSLKAGKTDQIALAVADVGNPVYVAMMHEISRVVTKAGYRLVVSSTGSDAREQIDFINSLDRGFADGLILSPLRVTEELIERIRSSRLPVVVIGSLPDDVTIDSVRADSPHGVALAVEHLSEQGRHRIAFLNGPIDTVPGTARLGGYLAAMTAADLPTSADSQFSAKDFTFKAGLKATAKLLDRCTPDAIICANDLLAMAALKVAAQRGIRVPEDLAIVGMDDTDLADLSNPALTSVNLGSIKRAKTAAKLLIRRLENPDADVRCVVIPPSLTVRESSAPSAAHPARPLASTSTLPSITTDER